MIEPLQTQKCVTMLIYLLTFSLLTFQF